MGKCDWDEVVVPERSCNWAGVVDGGGGSGWSIPPIEVEDEDSDPPGPEDGGGEIETGENAWWCIAGVEVNDAASAPKCEYGADPGTAISGPYISADECYRECKLVKRWFCYNKGTVNAYCVMKEYMITDPGIPHFDWNFVFPSRASCMARCPGDDYVEPGPGGAITPGGATEVTPSGPATGNPGTPVTDTTTHRLYRCIKDPGNYHCEYIPGRDDWTEQEVRNDSGPPPGPPGTDFWSKTGLIWKLNWKKWATWKGGFLTKGECEAKCKEPVITPNSPSTPNGAPTDFDMWTCNLSTGVCTSVTITFADATAEYPIEDYPGLYNRAGRLIWLKYIEMVGGYVTQEECEEQCPKKANRPTTPPGSSPEFSIWICSLATYTCIESVFTVESATEDYPYATHPDLYRIDGHGGQHLVQSKLADFLEGYLGSQDGENRCNENCEDPGTSITPGSPATPDNTPPPPPPPPPLKYVCEDKVCIPISVADPRYANAWDTKPACDLVCNYEPGPSTDVGSGPPPIDNDWVPGPDVGDDGDANAGPISGGGTTYCNPDCVMIPPIGMHWICNADTGSCEAWETPPPGSVTYENPIECMDKCYEGVDIDSNNISAGQERYLRWVCVRSIDGTSTCKLQPVDNPAIGHITEGDCQIRCHGWNSGDEVDSTYSTSVTIPPVMGWECNKVTGNCEYILGGTHATVQECSYAGCYSINVDDQITVPPPAWGWECNKSTGKCSYIMNGTHATEEECLEDCSPTIRTGVKVDSEGAWRWICQDSGCEFIRVSDPNLGHEEYSKCVDACEVDGGTTNGTIIISSDSYGGISQDNNVEADSFMDTGNDYSASIDNDTLFQQLLDFLKTKIDGNGLVRLDHYFSITLSNFFTNYPYRYAIVEKSKFIKLLKRSINVKGSKSVPVFPEALVKEFKKFMFNLNVDSKLGLNIKFVHRFWKKFDRRLNLIKTAPVDSEQDVEGNLITTSDSLIFTDVKSEDKDAFQEPELMNLDLLNSPLPLEKSISDDTVVENSKVSLQIAINKLAVKWRDGLNTISRTKPLKDQPFIPKDMDNLSQIIAGGQDQERLQLRKIYGDVNNSKISINQDIIFKVPHIPNVCDLKYTEFKIDFRSNLSLHSETTSPMYGSISFQYVNGQIIPYINEEEQKDMKVTSKDSIVMSVLRKAKQKADDKIPLLRVRNILYNTDMKFSEYLRLNEGNYGHEFGKEAEKHEAAKEANREHAAVKRDESTMAPKKPHLQVGANSQEVANRTMPPAEQAKLAGERKAWRDKLRPTGDDGGAQAARDAANTVKEPSGEVMNDPKTGKPFPKTGPLKDWQVPSLRESERPGEAINYGRDEEDEPEENTEDDGHAPKPKNTLTVAQLAAKKNLGEAIKKSGLPPLKRSPGDTAPGFMKKPEFPSIRPNESDEDTAIRDRMKSRDAREQRLKDTISKRQANESVGIPERDALGRLSIYSMQESSTPKPLRKALKKANMGKKLSNKESGRVMRNTKADGSTRTNALENYKNPQDDVDANDAAEADRRENAVGMDRQSHLDK